MIEYPWYGMADDDRLQQGDLLFDCPFDELESAEEGIVTEFDVVVVSHSCDLALGKLEMVQVCPFWDLEVLAKDVEFFRGKRGREDLRRGNVSGYHLLNGSMLAEKPTGLLVVDFRSQFAINVSALKSLAVAQKPRLRLLPPYREHLAQALARFYMRVGLPIDIPSF